MCGDDDVLTREQHMFAAYLAGNRTYKSLASEYGFTVSKVRRIIRKELGEQGFAARWEKQLKEAAKRQERLV